MSAPARLRPGAGRDGARTGFLRRPLDLCALALTGAAAWRHAAAHTQQTLVQPLPLTCRIAVVPTGRACGATTVALQLTGALTRSRRAPALVLSASPGTGAAADRLPFSRRWPLEEPVPTAVPPAELGPALRGSAGCGPDGLTSCLRLVAAEPGLPPTWHRARRELGHFFDTCLTEFGPLTHAELAEIAPLHHALVLVTPARRREVERARARLRRLAEALTGHPADAAVGAVGAVGAEPAAAPPAGTRRGRPPVVLHAVVATAPGHPLIPRLGPDEILVPYDPALRRPGPTPLRRRTAVAIAALAARAVDAAAQSARGEA
ncbi:hypothetical protein [Actinomyces ruminicola]|uniref:MinD-like ATPase involved in chromosome partitioning or flagellar assembly n=1 Tax=Actinomyces ruminicola TaxID=332524 RepID=A0A1G9Z802_9ACTO|nr:hypothetical protein [Actinomyces ruminicola]SDN17494.1 hypothetical protein SAMN04487766_11643 [Actinomyces ruminicola]